MEIITQAEAKALGLKRYFTGKPCKYGHISERYASFGGCIKCALLFANDKEFLEKERERIQKKRERIQKERERIQKERERIRVINQGLYDIEIITRAEAKALGIKRYFTGEPCKRGHISERYTSGVCIECKKEYQGCSHYKERNLEYLKGYREKNREKIKVNNRVYSRIHHEKRKEYRKNNKEKLNEKRKVYVENNKEKIRKKRKEYRENNKEKINEYYKNNKEDISIYRKGYYKNNKVNWFIRGALKRILNNWKGGRAEQEAVHGYKYEDLKHRLESQFKDGMSWDNHSEWHIDHIKPIKAFLDEGITDPAIVNALDNLQPLWAYDNLSKGAKWEG